MTLILSPSLLFGNGGGGGGTVDPHNLGWFATQNALETAYPTAEAGDFAIVGSTDTVWVWDTDNSCWTDSQVSGMVISVNNQTGAVTIDETDILPSQSGNYGKFLTTNGVNASWATVDALPSQTGNNNKYLKTNGTTASWENIPNEIPTQSGHNGQYLTTNGSSVSWSNVPTEIPNQSGHSGEYLTTNGTSVSWTTVNALPTQSGHAGEMLITDGTNASWTTPTTVTFVEW